MWPRLGNRRRRELRLGMCGLAGEDCGAGWSRVREGDEAGIGELRPGRLGRDIDDSASAAALGGVPGNKAVGRVLLEEQRLGTEAGVNRAATSHGGDVTADSDYRRR